MKCFTNNNLASMSYCLLRLNAQSLGHRLELLEYKLRMRLLERWLHIYECSHNAAIPSYFLATVVFDIIGTIILKKEISALFL